MNPDEPRLALGWITMKIIGCVLQVSNVLGRGFPTRAYEYALLVGY
jgi:hypothetical protein